jgi:hypothetical protein
VEFVNDLGGIEHGEGGGGNGGQRCATSAI